MRRCKLNMSYKFSPVVDRVVYAPHHTLLPGDLFDCHPLKGHDTVSKLLPGHVCDLKQGPFLYH